MITYKDHAQYSRVYLDNKHIGDIMRRINGMWFYQPKGAGKAFAGQDMPSRNQVKRSIEGE
jgi:hypothetical protein